MISFQFSDEIDAPKNGEQIPNTTVQIEEDGPSETFKDEQPKVNHHSISKDTFLYFTFVSNLFLT